MHPSQPDAALSPDPHPTTMAPWALAAVLGVLTTAFHLATAHDGWGLFRDELWPQIGHYG